MNTITIRSEWETGEATYSPVVYATLLNKGLKGLERVFEVSKTSLELALEHNAEVLASYKKALEVRGFFLLDLAGQAFEGYVTLQKSLLDLAVERPVIEAAQENSPDTSNAGMTDLILQSVDRTIAAQKSILARAGEQTKAAGEQPDINITPVESVEDIAQLQVDTLLAKEIVDLVVKQQPCINNSPTETGSDIVQLRVNTLRAKESVDLATNPLETTTDPSVN